MAIRPTRYLAPSLVALALGLPAAMTTPAAAHPDHEAGETHTSETRAAPTAKVEMELTKIDLGRVLDDETYQVEYPFENTGDAPLRILNVTVTCGCTSPRVTKMLPSGEEQTIWQPLGRSDGEPVLAPGERGVLHVGFDARGQMGDKSRTITLSTNAGGGADHPVVLHALVQPRVVVQPAIIDMGVIDKDHQGVTREFEVIGLEPDFRAARATVRSFRDFTIENLGNDTVEIEGKTFPRTKMRITLNPGHGVKVYDETVLVRTNDPVRRLVSAQVRARVLGDIVPEPQTVLIPAHSINERFSHQFHVKSREGLPFKIASVTEEVDTGRRIVATAAPAADTNSTDWIVTVSFGGLPRAGRYTGVLVLETDREGEERIELPYSGVIRP